VEFSLFKLEANEVPPNKLQEHGIRRMLLKKNITSLSVPASSEERAIPALSAISSALSYSAPQEGSRSVPNIALEILQENALQRIDHLAFTLIHPVACKGHVSNQLS